jgi:hypothetical protein
MFFNYAKVTKIDLTPSVCFKKAVHKFFFMFSILCLGMLLGGCGSLVRYKMLKDNESDLKNNRQPVSEYRQRRDEINRRLP